VNTLKGSRPPCKPLEIQGFKELLALLWEELENYKRPFYVKVILFKAATGDFNGNFNP